MFFRCDQASARANSRTGTHSCTEPRAIPKKFRRSALVNRPLPSALFAEMERCRSIELNREKSVAASEPLGSSANLIGEIDCLLINERSLKGERHQRRRSSKIGATRFELATSRSRTVRSIQAELRPVNACSDRS